MDSNWRLFICKTLKSIARHLTRTCFEVMMSKSGALRACPCGGSRLHGKETEQEHCLFLNVINQVLLSGNIFIFLAPLSLPWTYLPLQVMAPNHGASSSNTALTDVGFSCEFIQTIRLKQTDNT